MAPDKKPHAESVFGFVVGVGKIVFRKIQIGKIPAPDDTLE
jgi:hypothetical protein